MEVLLPLPSETSRHQEIKNIRQITCKHIKFAQEKIGLKYSTFKSFNMVSSLVAMSFKLAEISSKNSNTWFDRKTSFVTKISGNRTYNKMLWLKQPGIPKKRFQKPSLNPNK